VLGTLSGDAKGLSAIKPGEKITVSKA
jgi:hypothetical protein